MSNSIIMPPPHQAPKDHNPARGNLRTNVSIVEDNRDIRSSLAMVINNSDKFHCLAAYPDAETALREIPLSPPDIVLMDINLPGRSGIECLRQLKKQTPHLFIVMLTVYDNEDNIFESLKAGADGYLLKRTSPKMLLESLKELLQGGTPMSRQIARCVIQYFRDLNGPAMTQPAAEEATLTKREEEILKKLAEGYHYKEIAGALQISIHTVRNHIRNIYEKLHVHSRTEAVVKHLASAG